jgi:ribosomal protein L11 methyltransferase
MTPGSAFGTGSHETTRLVLEQLEQRGQLGHEPEMRVLDVGTGSGILAIACALFGACHVLALDTDPDAVRACEENAALNSVADRVQAECITHGGLAGRERYPLVLANIETRVLVPMAAELASTVASKGTLILSGILRPELDSVRRAYLELGLAEVRFAELGEWAAIVLEQSAP